MPLPIGVAECVIHFIGGPATGSQPVTTFGVKVDISTAQDIADAVGAWVVSDMIPLLCSQYEVTTVEVNDGTVDATHSVNTVGGSGTAVAPPNTAVLVRKNTGLVGRTNRGRMYWPGMITDAQLSDTGAISGAAVTALQSAADNLLTALTGLGGAVSMTVGGSGQPVTSLTVEAVAATQRRRLRA